MAVYLKTQPPHIRSPRSLTTWMWALFLCLAPVLLSSIFYFGWQAIRIFLIAWTAALISQFLSRWFFKRKRPAWNPDYLILASLYALLLPPTLPSFLVFIGGMVCCFLGLECFGGYGSTLFHPAALGFVFIHVSFPSAFQAHYALSGSLKSAFQWPAVQELFHRLFPDPVYAFWFGHGPALGEISGGFVLLMGLLLLWKGHIRWEFPVVYLFALACCSFYTGGGFVTPAFSGGFLFSAFYLMSLPGFSPTTRKGTRIFVVLTAVLTAILWRRMPYFAAWSYAVLIADLWIPWIDEWVRPKLSRYTKGLQ